MGISQMITVAPRRSFETEFINKNPILRKDEIVIVFDDIIKSRVIDKSLYESLVKYKRGNGVDHFKDLPYISAFEALNGGLLYVKDIIAPSVKIDLAYRIFEDLGIE